jgi:hypothetical protein
VTSATSRATVHNTVFPTCQTPRFIRGTEGTSMSSQESVDKSSQQRVIKVSSEVNSLLEVTVRSEVKQKRKVRHHEET